MACVAVGITMACGTGNEAAPPTAPPAVLPPVSSDPRSLAPYFPLAAPAVRPHWDVGLLVDSQCRHRRTGMDSQQHGTRHGTLWPAGTQPRPMERRTHSRRQRMVRLVMAGHAAGQCRIRAALVAEWQHQLSPPGAVSAPLAISAFDEQWWRRLKPAFRYESAPCATSSICSTTVVGATSRMHVQCPSGQPWPPCALHGRQGSSSRPSTT